MSSRLVLFVFSRFFGKASRRVKSKLVQLFFRFFENGVKSKLTLFIFFVFLEKAFEFYYRFLEVGVKIMV